MVSEKQTFDNAPDEDLYPFTTLREQMLADGFEEETISMIIGQHLDNPAAAREVYALLRESKVRQGELPAEEEGGSPEQEAAVPMSVQEKMGARAVGDTGTWRISGTLDEEEAEPSKKAVHYPYSAPPKSNAEGMDLSAEGIKAWVQQNHGR